MRTFDYKKIAEYSWDNEVLSYVAKIHECKGRQELYLKQRPAELERLVEIAKIQSTESSNRIEGIITTNARLKQLVEDKTTPRNRDEMEISECFKSHPRELCLYSGRAGVHPATAP